jgi:hypothetical protein
MCFVSSVDVRDGKLRTVLQIRTMGGHRLRLKRQRIPFTTVDLPKDPNANNSKNF